MGKEVRYDATVEVIYRFDNGNVLEKHYMLTLEDNAWNMKGF